MRRWGIAAILSVGVLVAAPCLSPVFGLASGLSVAFAQAPSGDVAASADDPPPPPPLRVGYGAMPGGLHVPTAETLPAGSVALALLSGYGSRGGLLGSDHSFNRALGNVAVAYAALPSLVLGLSLDGRYDKHTGVKHVDPAQDGNDDNYVGAPHVLARFATPRGKIALGGQLGIWLPGEDAPSIAVSAISVDARALLSIDAGFGTVSASAGFRIDNSAKSVDKPIDLTVEDQVSLGVSEFHAALAGVSLRVPTGNRAYVELEGSTEIFVGSGAPDPIFRGGALAGVAVSDSFAIVGFVELAKVRHVSSAELMAHDVVLIPYEPTFTGGIGLQARFGGASKRRPSGWIIEGGKRAPVEVLETADVSGIVIDDAGKPVVGARIAVKLKNKTGLAVTDDKGAYAIEKLPIGKTIDGKTELDDAGAEVSAEVANKKPATLTLTLIKGKNAVPNITLDPMLPPGQLRAVIINVGTSKPVAGATVTIEPGGVTATSGPDGKFTVDLPPGQYKLTVTARGLAQQQLDVTIEQNGVAIKNIDMHK